nr:MAG: hypothetical protein [Bacteriophage sp.]
MEIKYYYNCESRSIEAINMDNVKRIYMKYYTNSKKVSTLFFDDIKIHSIDKENMEDKISEIVNSEEKILAIYNSDIIKISFKDESRELIFKNGFLVFKEYIKSNNVNFEAAFKAYKVVGVRTYIEYMKSFDVIDYRTLIDYIFSFVISFMYLNHLKKLAKKTTE